MLGNQSSSSTHSGAGTPLSPGGARQRRAPTACHACAAASYAPSCQWRPRHSAGLGLLDAEAAVKWLRLIARKTTALNSQFGYAGSFAHYISRAWNALSLGDKPIGTVIHITGPGDSFSDGNMHRYHLPAQAHT